MTTRVHLLLKEQVLGVAATEIMVLCVLPLGHVEAVVLPVAGVFNMGGLHLRNLERAQGNERAQLDDDIVRR